jgi:hypothetical protein
MTKTEIVTKVKNLALPEGSYVVFGSCPLAAAGIREAGDIDLYVTAAVLAELKAQGWTQIHKAPGDEPYTQAEYEAHANWNFSPYAPTLEHLQKTATLIDGVPFASLEEVRKWKFASGGAKHLADVALIDQYLSSKEQ